MRDFRFWRRRRAEDDDLDRELALHLDLAAEEHAGDGPDDARLAARKEFGSVSLTKEEVRAGRPGAALERLLAHAGRDFLHGLRLLRRSPGFTVVAVLILALPIAANSVVFSMVNAVLLQPRPGRLDSLVSVFSQDRERPDLYRNFSYPLYEDLRDRSAIFESLTAHTLALVGIRDGDVTRRAFVEIVASNYFATLGVQLAAGRPFSLDEERPGADAPVAIASYAMWRRAGFAPSFIGDQVRVNGTVFTIVGIAPSGLRTTALVSPDWYFPLGVYDRLINEWFREGPTGLDDRGTHALYLAGAVAPGLTLAAAEAALESMALHLAKAFPATDRDRTFSLAPKSRLDLTAEPVNEASVQFMAGLLMLMTALVLGIACLNLANLMLARGAARRTEIGIRQALGGGRRRIVAQLVMEGLSVSAVGVVVGLLFAWWAHVALTEWLGTAVQFIATDGVDLSFDPSGRMILVAVGLALFSTACFALGPAWRLSRPSLISDLRDGSANVGRRFGSGTVLVAIQLTVSLALVAVSGLFVRSAVEAADADPGFSLDRLLVFSLDPSLVASDERRTRDLYRDVLDRVRAIPGVEHASLASKVTFGEFVESGFVAAPDRKNPDATAGFTIVTSDYFETLRLPVLRGRVFTPEEDARVVGATPAVISEPLARRLFPDADPIGRQIAWRPGSSDTERTRSADARETLTIVGLVPGTTQDILDLEPHLQLFVPYGARFRAAMVLHVGIGAQMARSALLTSVQRELRSLSDQLPILTARTMAAQRDASLPRWAVRAAALIFGIFGALALLIAAIGVYGLEAYEVARRTRELGIRVALGATQGSIRRLVLGQGIKAVSLALLFGLPLAMVLGLLLRSILYRVSPLDPAALLAAVVVLTAATLLACYVPARRATRIDALEALKTE